MKLQKLLSYTRKACDDYHMIQDGDTIAVAVSGGKDSLATLIALKQMQRFYPEKYQLEALTVSLGFPGEDFSPVQRLCDELGVRYTVIPTQIAEIVFEERKEKNPCSLCAKMRKGALNDTARKLSCNKVALGHNKDDIIETFFMSLLYEGRMYTFAPVTYLDRMDLYAIRPIMYAEEQEIKSFVAKNNVQVVASGCTVNGYTKRETTKQQILEWSKEYPNLPEKVFGAIRRSPIPGWKGNSHE